MKETLRKLIEPNILYLIRVMNFIIPIYLVFMYL